GRTAAAHFPLVRTLIVVVVNPAVKVGLNLIDRPIDLAPERHLVKLLQNRFMEPFTNAVSLWMVCLSFAVFDVVQGQVQLVIMALGLAAKLRPTISQDTQHTHALFSKER